MSLKAVLASLSAAKLAPSPMSAVRAEALAMASSKTLPFWRFVKLDALAKSALISSKVLMRFVPAAGVD
jgi:hypothetical protein